MKTIGMLMWIVGVAVFAFGAIGYDPSIEAYGLGERVANIALLQQQELIAMAGAALFLAGIILHAASEIIEALSPSAAPSSRTLPSPELRVSPAETESDAVLMERHGIALDGDKYVFGQYRYDRLADAVAYAKRSSKAG